MTQRPSFYAFAGGMDETTQALAVPKGRVIGCKNHESVDRGYGRVAGYERYDGHASPTAVYNAALSENADAMRDAARAKIKAIPGSGPVRGIASLNNQRFAWRDNSSGNACILWRATIYGWVQVDGVGNTFPPGGRYFTTNHNFYGASDRKRMYGVNGVGQGFEFDGESVTFISTGMPVDAPNRLAVYKQQLFFSFPGGSVQHSEAGEPTSWDAKLGAGEIGVGSDVTDFVTSANALHIGTVDSINTLVGNDETDFQLQPLTVEEGTGIIPFTAQTMSEPIYLDSGGLRGISATQTSANFRRGSLINQINRTFENKRKAGIAPVASARIANKDHYRLFFSDGTGVSVYFGRKYPEPMLFDLGHVVRCITTETSVANGERVFFGSDNGFVYELEVGSSYDGEEIVAYVQLPYDHEGSPWLLKRFHKAILELEASPATQIGMNAEFDYADGEQRGHPQQSFAIEGGGGIWDLATWNDFFWSSPAEGRAECYLDGQGVNMSIIIASRGADQVGYVLQGITKMVSVRGQKR